MVRINARAGEFWEAFFWPEWMVVEQRTFRPAYDGTTQYNAGDQVFWPNTQGYYQCVSATIGTSPTDGNGTLDLYHWALCASEYNGLPEWDANETCVLGDQRSYAEIPFVCIADESTGDMPGSTQTAWSRLIEFERLVSYEQPGETPLGEVRDVWSVNPRIHNEAIPIDKLLTEDGVVVSAAPPKVWVEFRLRAPTWLGANYSSSQQYNAGDQVYHQGDFWVATAALTNIPPGTSGWTKIGFPYVFRNAVPQAAFADMKRLDGMQDEFGVEYRLAGEEVEKEFDKIERQQGQTRRMRVLTRNYPL
jgi:hypothetical protein